MGDKNKADSEDDEMVADKVFGVDIDLDLVFLRHINFYKSQNIKKIKYKIDSFIWTPIISWGLNDKKVN